MVGDARFELTASCSQNKRATNCANPRTNYSIAKHLKMQVLFTTQNILQKKAPLWVPFVYASLTETILLIPFSSMVIPYKRSANSMVGLRCVITINCVSPEKLCK